MCGKCSGTFNHGIPEDLIREIIIRLPVNSQLQFKSVCKDWRTLISNPSWVKSHINHLSETRNPPLPDFLLFRSDGNIFSVHLRPNYDSDIDKGTFIPCRPPNLSHVVKRSVSCLRLLASCHGIICMIYELDPVKEFYLWNPVLNECVRVGYPGDPFDWDLINRCGFGYVSSIDSYKIVLVISNRPVSWYYNDNSLIIKVQIQVYCSRSKKWRASNIDDTTVNLPLYDLLNCNCEGVDTVVHNDSVYWIVGREMCYFILKFDLENEVFHKITIPELHPKDYVNESWTLQATVGVTEDNNLCICVVFTMFYRTEERPSFVQMWELRQGSWKKYLRIKGEWKFLRDNRTLLGFACKSKVMILEDRVRGKESMLVVDARRDPPSHVEVYNEYRATYAIYEDTYFMFSKSYVPTLLSPLSI